ncbi:hypothetical protein DS62_13015, partial [Smithella sp. SC_K08D17]
MNFIMNNNHITLPKVLIVGQSFNYSSGGGVTISHLFTNWKKSNLFSIHSGKENISFDICNNVYVLGYKERTHSIFRPFVRQKNKGYIVRGTNAIGKNDFVVPISKPYSKYSDIRMLLQRIGTYCGANHLFHHFQISKQLKKWLLEIAPDVIYAQYADYASMRFVLELHNILKIPLIVHIMDDWISIPPRTTVQDTVKENFLTRLFWKNRTNVLFNKLLCRASKRLVISEAMA